MAMPSKWDSKFPCPQCGIKPKKGELIEKFDWRWGHLKCLNDWETAEMGDEPTVVEFKKDFVPSEEQQAIFDFYGNLIVDAKAGTGKSTTCLQKMIRQVKKDPSTKILYLAFNKSAEIEFTEKVAAAGIARNVTVKTFHALGYAAVKKQFKVKRPDSSKLWNIIKIMLPDETKRQRQVRSLYKRLISLHKNTFMNPQDIVKRFNLDLEDEDLSDFDKVLAESNRQTDKCDFDDMLYFPVHFDLGFPYYNHIYVDEAQDCNAARLAICKKLKRKSNTITFVGDPFQAIYEFTGAFSDSMERILNAFPGTKTLPLSTTYRCAPEIVEMVLSEKLVDTFFSASTKKGIIRNTEAFESEVDEGDLVLCRMNAPLISAAFRLISMGKPIKLLGKGEMAQGLKSFIEDLKPRDVEDLYEKMEIWGEAERNKIRKRYSDPDRITELCELIQDKIDCIAEISGRVENVFDINGEIDRIFNSEGSITLSSVHKAKGLEARRVFILNPDKLPLYQGGQEFNIRYVALTRAEEELIFVQEEN